MRPARTWRWPRTLRYDELYNDLGPSSQHRSCPDCIIATRADMIFREGHLIEYSTYLAFLLSPFLTPASGKIHMATTMKTAVIMMYVEKSGRIGDPLQ